MEEWKRSTWILLQSSSVPMAGRRIHITLSEMVLGENVLQQGGNAEDGPQR